MDNPATLNPLTPGGLPETVHMELLPRTAFADMSLHAKNEYLQQLAEKFCFQTGRPFHPLDRDALSRLRRYYSRRVFSDLKLDQAPDSELTRALRALGEAIRAKDLNLDVAAALMAEVPAKPVLRAPPTDDAQFMFFVPAIYDAPIKDDLSLMDVAPFSLSKNLRNGVIRYELKDCIVTVDGSAAVGMATAFDYDIFLNMVSYLAEEVRRYRIAEQKGQRPDLPPKVYRPNSAHILKFCRRSDGGRQYEELEAALERLAATRIKIVNLAGGKRRQVDNRPLISDYRVVSKTSNGYIDTIEITIPDWIYMSMVRPDKSLSILTIHPDYFLIGPALGRFIYRLARKAAGKGDAHYTVADLHHRSGSSRELRKFAYDLKRLVNTARMFPLPEYDLDLTEGRDGPVLHMRYRTNPPKLSAEAPIGFDSTPDESAE
ncbi:MAG: replication protein [Pseudomonadota bacterium]|jgi:plasmid replication initiation protein